MRNNWFVLLWGGKEIVDCRTKKAFAATSKAEMQGHLQKQDLQCKKYNIKVLKLIPHILLCSQPAFMMKILSRISKVFCSMGPNLECALEYIIKEIPGVVWTYFGSSLLWNQDKYLLIFCFLTLFTGKITSKYVCSKLILCPEKD